jgi:hypothetical protein
MMRQRAEADDIYQDVILQLLASCVSFVSYRIDIRSPTFAECQRSSRIEHVRVDATSVSERHALKSRLHYLLTRQRGLSLAGRDGKLWPGLRVAAAKTVNCRWTAASSDSSIRVSGKSGPQELGEAVREALNHHGAPLNLMNWSTLSPQGLE